MMQLRDHTFLGTTQSLCPECLTLVSAKIIAKDNGRVYFRKRCPTHGVREDFVCSDVTMYDRMEFSLPGKLPPQLGIEPDKGCPFDCGLCTEHEQHTCIALVELTDHCNLTCPMCFASSAPGGKHRSLDECRAMIDRVVQTEGRPEVVQLSGGEPTLHPQFAEILAYAVSQPIDIVMINTNGIRLARDPGLVETIASHGPRVEVYFQFDGFRESTSLALRGESLVDIKLRAIEALGKRNIKTTLVVTVQGGVNDDELGAIVRFALERPWITGVSLQPATYSGRHVLPEQLERRATFPDVIKGLASQTDGQFQIDDFMPLPCAHPNCHSLCYVYRAGGRVVPLNRFIDARSHLDLLANGIVFNRVQARSLIETFLGRQGCCSGGSCAPADAPGVDLTSLPVLTTEDEVASAAEEFFTRAINETLSSADVLRITITSFLDAYNFDVRRLMKCCTHHVLPSGHIIPFCAYNVLYREGHVTLPELGRKPRDRRQETSVGKAGS